jgi:phenylalanyl-tRNA synthetase beta chain
LHSFQSVEILLQKEKIGFLGRAGPKITQNYRINEPVFVAQISLSKIFDYLAKFSSKIPYHPVSNFPTSERDLSFIFPGNIDYSEVAKEMKNTGGENLQEVNIFDTYRNAEMVKKGQKSASFRLIFQSLFGTLKNMEVEKVANSISKKIEKRFAAKLRD